MGRRKGSTNCVTRQLDTQQMNALMSGAVGVIEQVTGVKKLPRKKALSTPMYTPIVQDLVIDLDTEMLRCTYAGIPVRYNAGTLNVDAHGHTGTREEWLTISKTVRELYAEYYSLVMFG